MIVSRLAAACVALSLLCLPVVGQDASPAAAPVTSSASPGEWTHALSLFGEVKYPADFKNFDYVNPAAAKGGAVRFATIGTFDSFNQFVPKGNVATGIGNIYD
jgi:microcin C transport system substrate-binding protein